MKTPEDPNAPNLPYIKYTLENGLDVILLEDRRLPLVAVNVWYHVGPANERPGLTGFAHLFEHMMFEGSRHVGEKAHFRFLETAGASSINGTTNFDFTNYFETLPSNQLELALWLESDRMGFLLDTLDEKKLANQRAVVRNERRQNVESAPYGLVQEAIFHRLFPKDHPYHASVIGSHADIEAAELADVREFFRLYYAPNNASLAIVGDIDPGATRALVEKYFGSIPKGKPVPRTKVPTPPIASERRAVVTDQVELPRVYLAWLTAPLFTQEDAECDLVARILGGGKSSRLFKSLVYEKRIAQDVSAHQSSLALASIFTIDATCKPGVAPEELEKAVREELERFLEKGPEPEEIESARNIFEASIIRGLETLGGFGGVADRLNQYNISLGDPGYLERDLKRYAAATAESLRSTARDRLKRDSGVTVYGIPGPKIVDDVPEKKRYAAPLPPESSIPQGQQWRSAPPAAGPMPGLALPAPRSFCLGNGFNVFFIGQHNLPIVSANVIVLSGSERNPPDRPGLASFTAGMLDEGTRRRSALEIAADADRIGASLHTGSSMDLSYLAVRTLKKNADAAFELIADVLLNPAFDPAEMERIRHDRLTHIQQQKDNPAILGAIAFFGAVYGAGHPYGHTEIGTEKSNRSMTREHLAGFYGSGYVPANAALVVAGDMTESELRRLAGRYFGGWEGPASEFSVPGNSHGRNRRVVIVDRPEASQTVLRIGHAGVSRAHPDYVPIDVMNTALGGLFSSRINLNLREKNGFTYGASSSFVFRRGDGPFLVGTSVHAAATAPAVAEIFRELERMRESEVAPQELETAKDSIALSLPGLFETTADAASSIGQLFTYGLPPTWFRDLPERIRRISAAEVLRVAREHLKPEEAVVVAVGDRGKIESELGKLNLGPVEVRDADGNLL
ncbi:MAG: insulinase family protein [Acidobacteria bacterium]|nr:insulinase family protein [Acidobacteriota bacterium]